MAAGRCAGGRDAPFVLEAEHVPPVSAAVSVHLPGPASPSSPPSLPRRPPPPPGPHGLADLCQRRPPLPGGGAARLRPRVGSRAPAGGTPAPRVRRGRRDP